MYSVDEKDRVVELTDIPGPDTGAPFPTIVANEYRCIVSYECSSLEHGGRALIIFTGAFYFGRPNDEAIHGHPLASRGLHAYAAFEVKDSSWIRLMEVRNRVHSRHDPKRFSKLRHIIITFHDSTLEFVTEKYAAERWKDDSGETLLSAMLARFRPVPQSK